MKTKSAEKAARVKARLRQSHLQYLLGRCAGAVGRAVPYFLLEVYLTRVACTATDYNTTIVAEIHLQDGEEIEMGGVVCIPAKKLSALVDALPDTTIILTGLDGNRLQVECGDYSGVLPGVDPAAHFPTVTLPSEPAPWGCDGDLIPDLYAACAHALPKETGKTLIEGLRIRQEDSGRLVGVATDGQRLSVAAKGELEYTNHASVVFPGATIPARALAELKKINAGSVEIHLRENDLVISAAGITIMTRLLEGEYPDFRRVIPAKHPHCCVVNASDLAAVVERVDILSESDNILLDIQGAGDGGDIRVSAGSTSGDASDLVAADVTGEGLFIRVTPRHLLEALRSLGKDSEDIVIKYGTETESLVLLPADHSGWDERLELVMPRKR